MFMRPLFAAETGRPIALRYWLVAADLETAARQIKNLQHPALPYCTQRQLHKGHIEAE